VRIIIFFRLVANWCLTAFGNLLTLGMGREMRHRWGIYTELLRWHLRGCPRSD